MPPPELRRYYDIFDCIPDSPFLRPFCTSLASTIISMVLTCISVNFLPKLLVLEPIETGLLLDAAEVKVCALDGCRTELKPTY